MALLYIPKNPGTFSNLCATVLTAGKKHSLIRLTNGAEFLTSNKNLHETDMTTERAWKIIGNSPKWAIRNMIRALSIHPWNNTAADIERLAAARIAIKTNNPRFT